MREEGQRCRGQHEHDQHHYDERDDEHLQRHKHSRGGDHEATFNRLVDEVPLNNHAAFGYRTRGFTALFDRN